MGRFACTKFVWTSLLALGFLLFCVGISLFYFLDIYVKEQVKERVIISNKSETYDIWQNIPIPVYMQFYMFNTTNPDEVLKGEKPALNQVGPYTYREYREKFDIVWNENGTVTYKQNRTFYFVREMSVGDDTDELTTINPLMPVVVEGLKWLPGFVKKAVFAVMERSMDETMFIKKPIKKLLFGYEDPALTELHGILPMFFPTTTIGYFIRKNYTDDGLYTVYTGRKHIEYLGGISRYNGKTHVDIWTTEWANMVNGSDGTLGPPFRFDEEYSPVFVSDICRSIRGIKQGTVDLKGITLYRYGGDQYDMANATMNPDNIGFCTPQSSCLPTGLLNSTLCQEPVDGFKIPLIFSFPHFLYADRMVQDSVYGLHPNEEEHQTVIDTEPWTGLVLQVAKRLQFNMFVESVPDIKQTGNIRTLYFPILWLNESSVADDKHVNMLKDELFIPKQIAEIGRVVAVCLGAVMALVGGGLWIRHKATKNRRENYTKLPDTSGVEPHDASQPHDPEPIQPATHTMYHDPFNTQTESPEYHDSREPSWYGSSESLNRSGGHKSKRRSTEQGLLV